MVPFAGVVLLTSWILDSDPSSPFDLRRRGTLALSDRDAKSSPPDAKWTRSGLFLPFHFFSSFFSLFGLVILRFTCCHTEICNRASPEIEAINRATSSRKLAHVSRSNSHHMQHYGTRTQLRHAAYFIWNADDKVVKVTFE
jgi:hypothetical protein